jgi:hypothetical protein
MSFGLPPSRDRTLADAAALDKRRAGGMIAARNAPRSGSSCLPEN